MIRMVVCVKQVLDPEAPPSLFRIDPQTMRAMPSKGTPPVLNPFDESALEAALRIKDVHQGSITVISMGSNLAKAVILKSLAAGADELILLEDQVFEGLDSYSTAYALATAIRKTGEHDLILTGRESADWNAGQVGSGIAEILGIPSLTIAQKVELIDGKARVQRELEDGYEVVEAPLPCLVTVGSQVGELRSISVTALLAAKKKPLTVWKAEDLEIEPSTMGRTKILKLFAPDRAEVSCQIIEGTTDETAGENLASKLRDIELI
jgi:electron transfer flavoprotein beta subunit